MRIAEMLKTIATWLSDPNNEALLLAEENEECLKVTAEGCLKAAGELYKAAEMVDALEPKAPSKLDSEALDHISEIATAFDQSGDDALKKSASVLDELLLTIAADPNVLKNSKSREEYRLEELKRKYDQNRKDLAEGNKIAESEKAIEKSKMTEPIKSEVGAGILSARTCVKHPGAQLQRIGEHTWQCDLDKEILEWPDNVALQTQNSINWSTSTAFQDSREGRLQNNK